MVQNNRARTLTRDTTERVTLKTTHVLAGVIGAMLGQGLDSWYAAQAGVVIHAAAGDLAAEQIGQRGMLAGDITAFLPAILEAS